MEVMRVGGGGCRFAAREASLAGSLSLTHSTQDTADRLDTGADWRVLARTQANHRSRLISDSVQNGNALSSAQCRYPRKLRKETTKLRRALYLQTLSRLRGFALAAAFRPSAERRLCSSLSRVRRI